MAGTTTRLLTVAEYDKIPNPPGGRYALYHGELVEVPFAKSPHIRAQWQIRHLFEKAAGPGGVVNQEMPYRPLPEYECWAADVAYLSRARWDSMGDWLAGAPELVVEVLSPSNRRAKMADKEKLCLENGCLEFWQVDLSLRQVRVSTPDGRTITYKTGQQIPLFFAPGASISVAAIFAE